MARPFTLAHLSDVHLGPLPPFSVRHWNAKRALGYLNWIRVRRRVHLPQTLALIVADLKAQAPDHIAVTGDLVNIGLPDEYELAARWLELLGPPSAVSLVPGNHDIYTRLHTDPGVARWGPYMSGFPAKEQGVWPGAEGAFPYLRDIGGIALVGLNSAIPTRPFRAVGRIGQAQLSRLALLLSELAQSTDPRVVLVHHPALPRQASPAKALSDAAELEAVLTQHGAELVIHGHNHRPMIAFRTGPTAPIAFVGVPSASHARHHHDEPLARYHLYRLSPRDRTARIEMIARGLTAPEGPVVELERRTLVP